MYCASTLQLKENETGGRMAGSKTEGVIAYMPTMLRGVSTYAALSNLVLAVNSYIDI
jgi:hypothetical protein